MDRRLCLHALTTAAACAMVPGGAFSTALHPVVTPLPLPNEISLPSLRDDAPDPLYSQAVAIVMINQKASIGLVQRHLKIGYNHATRLLASMEQAGLIGSFDVHGHRQILAHHSAVRN